MSYYKDELMARYAGKRIAVDLDALSGANRDFDWDQEYSDDDEPAGGNGYYPLCYREYSGLPNANLSTAVSFTVNADGEIESVEPCARVFCFGDSGLGECDPEEEWDDEDLEIASQFLNTII